MPVTVINRVGMPVDVYDSIMVDVAAPLRAAPGFVSHTAHLEGAGVTVTEVWESLGEWRAWFDTSVRPHLPPGAGEPELIGLHSALGR